jgi:hypothetical protein
VRIDVAPLVVVLKPSEASEAAALDDYLLVVRWCLCIILHIFSYSQTAHAGCLDTSLTLTFCEVWLPLGHSLPQAKALDANRVNRGQPVPPGTTTFVSGRALRLPWNSRAYSLPKYFFPAVSMRMMSPLMMNSGTMIWRPVSSFASFHDVLNPVREGGAVSTTLSGTSIARCQLV